MKRDPVMVPGIQRLVFECAAALRDGVRTVPVPFMFLDFRQIILFFRLCGQRAGAASG